MLTKLRLSKCVNGWILIVVEETLAGKEWSYVFKTLPEAFEFILVLEKKMEQDKKP